MITRRQFHGLVSGAIAGTVVSSPGATEEEYRRPLGVCDWTLKLRHDLAAFDVAKELGLAGVQVSFGEPGVEMDLRNQKDRELLVEKAEETGLRIASLGMGVLNSRPLASDPDSAQWVADSLDVIASMKREYPEYSPDVVLLAFFAKGDLKGDAEAMDSVITRLKKIAPRAEEVGVTFGIESLLDRSEHEAIMDGVGSPSVQVYYDTANSAKAGYDIYDEVVQLGSERICEIHCKENGARIGEGEIDFESFRGVLDQIGYEGWLVLEGSRVKGNELMDDYRANAENLRMFFGA